MNISHQFSRVFQANKIHAPRDFKRPTLPENLPVFIEIGAGKGKHALQYASLNSTHYLVAIERTKEKFQAFSKAAAQQQLSNLSAVHADAIAWMVHALPAKSLSGVYILYPNPEPGNPNQRWLNMPFFEFILSRVDILIN